MIEQITTDTEFWRPILPYIGGIIIAFCAFVAAILYAASRWIKASAEKEETAAKKEEQYLGLVNDLRSDTAQIKDELAVERKKSDQFQTDLFELKKAELILQRKIGELETMQANDKTTIERLTSEVQELRNEVGRLTDERNTLLTTLDRERQERQVELDRERQLRQTAEIERTQAEVKLEQERTTLNEKISTLEREVAELKSRIELLNHVKESQSEE